MYVFMFQLKYVLSVYITRYVPMHMQCFRDIYPTSSAEKVIVAMGDNDLGGEGRDLMTQTVYRYNVYFM